MEIGSVLEGKVTGVMKFGAFISLPEGKSGLCHISEVSNSFVADINEYVKLGDSVKVKVISISPDGKINLSIKKAEAPDISAPKSGREFVRRPPTDRSMHTQRNTSYEYKAPPQAAAPTDDKDFEMKLKKFMQESDSRISGDSRYADRPRKNRRR